MVGALRLRGELDREAVEKSHPDDSGRGTRVCGRGLGMVEGEPVQIIEKEGIRIEVGREEDVSGLGERREQRERVKGEMRREVGGGV